MQSLMSSLTRKGLRWVQDGDYLIVEDGRVFSLKTYNGRKPGKLLKACPMSTGYPAVSFSYGENRKTMKVHALLGKYFLKRKHGDTEIRHKDGNRKNFALSNLEWCTTKENMADKKAHGTNNSGVKNARAKLTEIQVDKIRIEYKNGHWTYPKLAKVYGVDHKTIWFIVNNKTWAERLAKEGLEK